MLFREANALFGTVFADLQSYASSPPNEEWVGELLSDPGFVLQVAIDDGRLIGAMASYVLRKFEQARREIYIYDLAIAESHRRRGVATALISDLRTFAAATGAYVIFVQADHGDEPAIALYEKLGRREDVLHFDIDPH